MTIIQPIGSAGLGTIVLRPLPDVQPFSIQSGYSFEGILSDMRTWLRDVLVPYLNDNGPVVELETYVNASLQTVLDQIATADVPVSDALFAAVLPDVTTATRKWLDAHYKSAIVIAPDGTTTDYAATINAALATGQDVVLTGTDTGQGVFPVGATLTLAPTRQGQRFTTANASIKPTFLGTVVAVTNQQVVRVLVDGSAQPSGDDSVSYAIRVGNKEQGWNPQQASVAGSTVRSFKGTGFYFDSGAMIDCTHAAAYDCTRDGFSTRADGNDNNHLFFANTHAVNCGGAGYAIRGNGADMNNGGSRHNIFDDAKAFGCTPNFYIESRSNGGRIFSELGTTPDHLTVNSRGNDLQWHETAASFESAIDDGQGNRLSGYSTNNDWTTKELHARTIKFGADVGSNKSTRITEWITGQYPTGAVTIGAGASVTLDPGVAGGGSGRSVDFALFAADATGFVLSPFFDAQGNLKFTAANLTGASKVLNGTISYGIKRFA